MVKYSIQFQKSAIKELNQLPKKDLLKIIERIEELASNPRKNGTQKLSGQEKYRLRQGNYRIIYLIDDKKKSVFIYRIGHRKDIYN